MLFYCCVPGATTTRAYCWNIKWTERNTTDRREKKKRVGADSSIKLWVMVHFIYVRFSSGAIMTRHLQPRENASTVRGHATSNGGQDLSRRFQSALALSQPAGMDPWDCSVYLQTDCRLCGDASLSPGGFTVRNIST